MQSKATTVEKYLAELPDDRRAAIQAVRQVILKHLGRGFEERMQYGMIGYCVPHCLYPAGYHCDPKQPLPFAALASQKNYMSLYLWCIYTDPGELRQFQQAWAKSGLKLDMGKSCIRFKRLDQLPLDVIAAAIKRVPVKRFVAYYEAAIKPKAKTGSKQQLKPSRAAENTKPAGVRHRRASAP